MTIKWETGTDSETEELMDLVDNGWSWEWPGWGWVAERLNYEYENDRSAGACRNKYHYEEKKECIASQVED